MRRSTSVRGHQGWRRWRLRGTVVLTVVLALGAWPAWAYWTSRQDVPATTFTLGKLDLQVNGSDNISDFASLDASGLFPGQAVAGIVTVGNTGSVPLTYWVSAAGTNPDSRNLVGSLQVKVTTDTDTNGTAPNVRCPGATIASTSTLTTTDTAASPSPVVGTATVRRPTPSLAAGASEKLCVEVALSATAPSTVQGGSSVVTLTFHAEQVAKP